MKVKQDQLVKINASGRVSITLSRSVKPSMLSVLEKANSRPRFSFGPHGETMTKIRLSLIQEVYLKYFTILHLDRVNRILLSRAQAYALWVEWAEPYSNTPDDAELGNLMMQLHQRLS